MYQSEWQTGNGFGPSREAEYGGFGAPNHGGGPLREEEEMEYAAHLLGVNSEDELEEFLGDLVKSVAKAAGGFIHGPVGRALTGALKSVAQKALPMVGGALGTMIAPGVGTALGSQLGSAVGGMFEMEYEAEEEAEFETARRYVQLAAAAAHDAAHAPPDIPPPVVAHQALVSAAERVAPELLPQLAGTQRRARAAGPRLGGERHRAAQRPVGAPRPPDHPVRDLTGFGMDTNAIARWALEQEARALLTRLGRVRPFALQETMLPAASLSPAAQIAIERFLIGNRYQLRQEVIGYVRWLRGTGENTSAAEMQRRFTIVRLRFNDVLTQFDLFSELITQRSEHDTGVWLAGLDALAADAMAWPGGSGGQPEAVCYLARGPGAAVRRARTRLPGGGLNPVAIIRVPRERMVGHGVASSLVHEVGHQVAALLQLVESVRPALRAQQQAAESAERAAWDSWYLWVSEAVADAWATSRLGIGSTLGLMSVVGLPAWFVFRANTDDVHPTPWIRVKLSCALGDALYPHRQWRELADAVGGALPGRRP